MNWLKNLWAKIWDKVEETVITALEAAVELGLNEIWETVKEVVAALEKTSPGQDKQAIAKQTIKARFPDKETMLINLAIELAVILLKKKGLEVKK